MLILERVKVGLTAVVILTGMLLGLLSCSTDTRSELIRNNSQSSNRTNETRTIILDDSTAVDVIRFVRFRYYNGKPVVSFLNDLVNTIYAYDWITGELLTKIHIPSSNKKWGFSSADVINYELVTLDSVWVSGNGGPYIALYNGAGKRLQRIKLPYESNDMAMTMGEMIQVESHLYFHCKYLQDEHPAKKPFAFRYNLNHQKLDTLDFLYPEEFYTKYRGNQNEFFKRFSFTYNHEEKCFIYSFLATPDLITTDLNLNKLSRIPSGVEGLAPEPMSKKEKREFNFNFNLTPIMIRNRFLGSKYSLYDRKYYRLIRLGLKKDDIPTENVRAVGLKNQHGMLIIGRSSSDLYLFPDSLNNTFWNKWILTKSGVYVPEKTENEDELVFRKYEFN